ncbi:hypothetical protein HDU93_000891, partial [Gonapodya sp. JEL0774]
MSPATDYNVFFGRMPYPNRLPSIVEQTRGQGTGAIVQKFEQVIASTLLTMGQKLSSSQVKSEREITSRLSELEKRLDKGLQAIASLKASVDALRDASLRNDESPVLRRIDEIEQKLERRLEVSHDSNALSQILSRMDEFERKHKPA